MGKDIGQRVMEEAKKSLYYAIQLDESTDVSNCAVPHCLVRYKGITNVKEELHCCINLPGRATGSEIFRLLNEYLCKNKTEWGNCVGISHDGAAAMTGHHSGAVTESKEFAHKILALHTLYCTSGTPGIKKTVSGIRRYSG